MVPLLLSCAGVGLAQVVDTTLWVTNGPVYTIAPNGNTIYIGGRFNHVGPFTGSAAAIDASTGSVQQPYPKVTGTVKAVAPDGSGGWYLGGVFTAVRGQPRNNLAQLDASGRLTDWNPNANGEVAALAVSGGMVYAGGSFTNIGGQTRNKIAALDAASGAVTAWNPNASGAVHALAVSAGTVYAGGKFGYIGGQTRYGIAALDAATGAATDWSPASNGTVYTLAVSGATVFVGGDFTVISGQQRSKIAALDAFSGAPIAWDPNVSSYGTVYALAVSGNTVFVGGFFPDIGGQRRDNIAAVDMVSGAVTSWNPDAGETYYLGVDFVSALVVNGGTVYAGGHFATIGGQLRNHIAALDAVTGAATPWEPNASGSVYALAVGGGTVYAGGSFASMGGKTRNHLAALDATTGAATSWNPNPTGGTDQGGHDIPLLYGVLSVAVSGSTVYAGGHFTGIGGQPRYKIGAVDASTGAATAWNPGVIGSYPARHEPFVTSVAPSGGLNYVGGALITHIGGQPRKGLAAVDVGTGAATAWDANPNADGFGSQSMYEVVVDGGTVYVAGGFTSIGGQPRNGAAALDATTGLATAWNPNPSGGTVGAFAISGSTVYVGGAFTSIGGQTRGRIAALDAVTGAATAWNPNALGTSPAVSALAVSGGTIYAGGAFTSIGGQARNNIAALDEASGAAIAWDPDANGGVNAIAVSGGKVFVGGAFTRIGGQPQSGIAAVSAVDPETATLLAQFEAAPSADGIELRWSFGDASRVASVAVERAPATEGPWLAIAPELYEESGVTVALDRTAGESGEYFYRLVVQLAVGGQTVFGPVSASQLAASLKTDLKLLSANPSSGGAQVQYSVARAGRVRLEVVDVSGRVEETLADRVQAPGRYVVTWDGVGRRGRVAPGLYFIRLVAPDLMTTRKLAIIW